MRLRESVAAIPGLKAVDVAPNSSCWRSVCVGFRATARAIVERVCRGYSLPPISDGAEHSLYVWPCGRVLSRRRDRLWSCLRGVVAPAHLLSHDQATQLLSAMVSCPALVGLHFTGRSGTMACPAFAWLIAVHG